MLGFKYRHLMQRGSTPAWTNDNNLASNLNSSPNKRRKIISNSTIETDYPNDLINHYQFWTSNINPASYDIVFLHATKNFKHLDNKSRYLLNTVNLHTTYDIYILLFFVYGYSNI